MGYRQRVLVAGVVLAVAGSALLCAGMLWMLWKESLDAEEAHVGSLAAAVGERTEAILLDTRDLLARLDALEAPRCGDVHLKAMQDLAMARPHLRALGHWRAAERLCGVGFVDSRGLRPPRADRIYESGAIAWWPGPHTEVGGVQLFLMRFGDHDAALDPRMLIDTATLQDRQAGLWVEGLRLAAVPWDAELPLPDSLPHGLHLDRRAGLALSRFSQNAVFPIDIVAVEPLDSLWLRQRDLFGLGAALALALLVAWLMVLLRILRGQLSPAAALRRALRQGHVVAYYQPVVEFASGRCVGAEALARWQREDGRLLVPDAFLPLAEQEGLMPEVTRAMLTSVLREAIALRHLAPGLSINLNLAPQDLEDEDFAGRLAKGLRRAGLPTTLIKLEITERGLINSDAARALIRRFRSNGHQVAVDDFGTGYSSLSYLESFELDILKIDKSFVDAIGTEAATSQVIGHVIEMAHSLGLELVAEGVRSTEQVVWLTQHGVRFGQGFLYSPALSPSAFHAYLKTHADTDV